MKKYDLLLIARPDHSYKITTVPLKWTNRSLN